MEDNTQDNQQSSNTNTSLNKPQIGMDLDSNPIDIGPSAYTLLVNGNIMSADGSILKITNEPSSLLCSRFKPGYLVIGRPLYIPTQKLTVFFLVNPTTHSSEIGGITNIHYDDNNDRNGNCQDCNHPVIEDIPLEKTVQTELCNYITIVNASCLNFNINYPIDSTYEIGVDVLTQLPDCDNITIFFTDSLNPRRFINLKNIPQQIIGVASGNCNQPIHNGLLDCNEILVAPNYTNGCVMSTQIRTGGQNKAGSYQFAAYYCDVVGDSISDSFTVSNPVSVWDSLHTIVTNTDYVTGQAISVNISNLDNKHFLYLKLIVVRTINNVTTPYQVGIFPINSTNFTYTYTGNNAAKELPVSINELLSRKTHYDHAKGVMKSNDILFWYNLTEQRIINLQPVVNNLRLQWQTIEVEEGFYADGTHVANYLGEERDEVYSYGIEFRKTNGYKLPTFLISANSASEYQTITGVDPYSVVNNSDVLSNPACCVPSGCQLNQLWQVYNIATNNGIGCNYLAPSSGTSTFLQTEYCSSLYQVCPNTLTCDFTHYPYPIGTPVSCCPSGATNCQTVGDPILVTPSGTQVTNVYGPIVAYSPSWTDDLPFIYTPSGCSTVCSGDPSCCLADISTYSPLNSIPTNPYNLFTANSNTCAVDPYAQNSSNRPTIFFASSSANVPLVTNCGTLNAANATWYQFNALGSTQRISAYPFVPTSVAIVAYSDFGVTEIGCNVGTSNAFVDLQNLTTGTTYYFVVFTPDPTFSTLPSPYTNAKWLFGTLCLSVPNPTGTITTNIPAVYQQTYSYEVEGSTSILNTPSCEIQTYQYGDFSFWESTAHYPSNPDVWGDLCGKPIRHHKFPDCAISHIHNGPLINTYGTKNKIYPLGVRLDINQVKSILNQAVTLGLITEAEKLDLTGYSIKRGNRRSNRSIVGKGLLTDVWRTPQLKLTPLKDDDGKVIGAAWLPISDPNGGYQYQYYPNYFFNDSNTDYFLLNYEYGTPVVHPYKPQNYINGRYAFHGTNTSFNQPFLTNGQELKLETVEYGHSKGAMNEVLYHAKYVLLTASAYALAEGLAQLEILLEATNAAAAAGEGIGVLGTSAGSIITYAIEFAIAEAAGVVANSAKYTSQWAEIFKNLGTPQNPAMYYTGVGFYNQFVPVVNNGGARKRALINNSMYLTPGNFQFQENGQTIKFNNFERETSVYLSTDAFTSPVIDPTKAFQNTGFFGKFDSSRLTLYNDFSSNCSLTVDSLGDIAGYYASIKNYVPDQYGTIDQIEWLDTGYCGIIDWKNPSQSTICDTIFGGDTFIGRFAYKEKIPMFTDDRVFTQTTSINTDVFYENLANVGFPQYFFNSMYNDVNIKPGNNFFGFTPPTANFLCSNNTFFYQRGKCPLYFYTIPYFICESDYNVDLRHGEDELAKNFYPYVGDIVNWTQQYQVPISTDNYYFYNNDYSKQNFENFAYILKDNFSNLTDTCQTYHPTRMIWSVQGTNYWLNYLPADVFDFPREDGTVLIIKELEELKVLVVQEQNNKVFNAYNTINTSGITVAIKSGTLLEQFQNKPSQIYATDLGFAGTQNFAIESTPKGTFYVDTRNPAILSVTRSQYGRNITNDILEAREGKTKVTLWMRQNLPFQIIKDYPNVDINNPYKYFGIATCWDNKFDRLFITKRDARIKPEFRNIITFNEQQQEFYLNDSNGGKKLVIPTDETYFEQKSWTISYNPTIGEWASFFTFFPNYYVGKEDSFQSGYNFPLFNTNDGLYSHLLTNKSYQIFNSNKIQPFLFEYVLKDTITNTLLNGITVNSEFYRYQKDLNEYMMNGVFLNYGLIYNQTQSSGNLNLVVTEKNNQFQLISYPKYNVDSRDILVENVSNLWNFNNYNNVARLNIQPMNIYSPSNVMWKEPNPLAMNYAQVYAPNKIKGDYYNVRMGNTIYSNYKIIMKHGLSSSTKTV